MDLIYLNIFYVFSVKNIKKIIVVTRFPSHKK